MPARTRHMPVPGAGTIDPVSFRASFRARALRHESLPQPTAPECPVSGAWPPRAPTLPVSGKCHELPSTHCRARAGMRTERSLALFGIIRQV